MIHLLPNPDIENTFIAQAPSIHVLTRLTTVVNCGGVSPRKRLVYGLNEPISWNSHQLTILYKSIVYGCFLKQCIV